jgi:lysophospholipase L1-like esterase
VTTEGPGRVEVVARGKVELLGLVVERKEPGVVLDTVGLNGARFGTFLAWDEASWVAEVARRHPDLVVITLGTNETSDPHPEAERYEKQLTQLLGRVRAAAPDSECLVVTPMDRAGPPYAARIATISEGLQRAAAQGRCAVWSALQAMGGPGSAESWAAETPPRAAADGVHLTPKGYQSLAESLGRDLVPR